MTIWEPKPPGTLWATLGLLWDCFTFLITTYQNDFVKNKHYFLNTITVKCNQLLWESIFRLSFQ